MNKKASEIIIIVLVLYKKNIDECVTYQTLKKHIDLFNFHYQLIIYNNSSEYKVPISIDYSIVNSIENNKLPEAYNYALNYAIKNKNRWLLLLDQDTELTKDYFTTLSEFLIKTNDNNILAVVPILKDGNTILSPKKISSIGWWENKLKHTGLQDGRVIAFNSLSLLRVDFLKKIGGFSEAYQLDMLDVWYYNQIYLQKKKVYVLDSFINHSLSFQNYEKEVSISRHIDFLNAEKMFVKELKLSHFISYKLKLFLRSIKQFIIFKNKEYAKFTFKKFISK